MGFHSVYNNAEEAFSGINNEPNKRRNTNGFRNRLGDGGLPEINFLKPVLGGQLVDTGVDVGISFEGSAPDIGPFEYTSAPADDSSDGGNSGSSSNGNGSNGDGCFLGSLPWKSGWGLIGWN